MKCAQIYHNKMHIEIDTLQTYVPISTLETQNSNFK